MRRITSEEAAAWALGAPLAVWGAVLLAPAIEGGEGSFLARAAAALSDPAAVTLTASTPKVVLAAVALYLLAAAVWWSARRNWRRREEHGSAQWGSPAAIGRRYRQKPLEDNIILTQHFLLGIDAVRHRRNLNVLVVGGSGAGKTRGYAKPNVMQANSSMVILDPKGEIARATGRLLEEEGYEVRVLDLVNMERSHCYNPFAYLDNDNDVQRLSTNLFKATTPKGAASQDPFWDTAAAMLHQALIFYLLTQAPPEEQNYAMLMELLRAGEVREEDEEYQSILDELFERLEMEDPSNIALKYYRDYRAGSAKTLKSIQITLSARLEKFNLDALASLTAADELDLASLGERKCALFAVIPDNDTSYNFLISILYLGGNEQSTHKYVSELLGKETIDTASNTRSTGRNGNWSTNWQLSGRELLTPDEVRMVDNAEAILFVRGERPVRDEKYDLARHPRIRRTSDGGAPPYLHGRSPLALVSISAADPSDAGRAIPLEGGADVVALTEEEVWGQA